MIKGCEFEGSGFFLLVVNYIYKKKGKSEIGKKGC